MCVRERERSGEKEILKIEAWEHALTHLPTRTYSYFVQLLPGIIRLAPSDHSSCLPLFSPCSVMLFCFFSIGNSGFFKLSLSLLPPQHTSFAYTHHSSLFISTETLYFVIRLRSVREKKNEKIPLEDNPWVPFTSLSKCTYSYICPFPPSHSSHPMSLSYSPLIFSISSSSFLICIHAVDWKS